MRKVLVIGGGAAGMMAALTAAEHGAAVTLIERNEKLGKKVYITGKGRCNVTNDCDRDTMMKEVARNPRFLYSALDAFPPQAMMDLLEQAGCPVTVQRGRRVFPTTERASDVIRTLQRLLERAGVKVLLHTRVRAIRTENGAVVGVVTEAGEALDADAVIVATGGVSYPMTGSTGDGYAFAENLGHTTTPRRASLSALETEDTWCAALQGLSLKNVSLRATVGKKLLYEELGEMLFTHFGISGPLVLTLSCHLPDDVTTAQVRLNLKPGLTEKQLDDRLLRDFAEQPRKQLDHVLPGLLPGKLAALFASLCGIDGTKPVSNITSEERKTLAATLQALPIRIRRLRPVEEAIVTRGGVKVNEITPSTMESKLVPGLYFAGEVLDVDAHTGGYNLQIAWCTGHAAGLAAAEEPYC